MTFPLHETGAVSEAVLRQGETEDAFIDLVLGFNGMVAGFRNRKRKGLVGVVLFRFVEHQEAFDAARLAAPATQNA